jgi:flagellar motor protein MotB
MSRVEQEGIDMTAEAEIPDDPRGRGAALLRRLTMARAATLARAKRYDDAAELLASGTDRTASELDLLARVRAQQGRVVEAEALWTEARKLEPEDERIAAALRRLRAARRGQTFRPVITLAAVVVAFGLGMMLRGREPVPVPPPPIRRLPLESPGVEVRRTGDTLSVVFARPLFAGGTQLTAEGGESLTQLGRKLEVRPGPIRIVVRGVTDDVPVAQTSRFRDNDDLALARATAAVQHLVATTRLPAASFAIQSTVEPNLPAVPADGRRTVVLYVIEQGHGNGS